MDWLAPGHLQPLGVSEWRRLRRRRRQAQLRPPVDLRVLLANCPQLPTTTLSNCLSNNTHSIHFVYINALIVIIIMVVASSILSHLSLSQTYQIFSFSPFERLPASAASSRRRRRRQKARHNNRKSRSDATIHRSQHSAMRHTPITIWLNTVSTGRMMMMMMMGTKAGAVWRATG